MDVDAQRLFVHLSRSLHFGRTSRECHVSPSALSRTIQRLETELGWPLFERDNRRVSLTPEGQAFAAYADGAVRGWEEFRRGLSKTGHLAGEIAVFASVTACQSFLPRLLSRFRNQH